MISYCECGCGCETTIYRNKPRRFIAGHSHKNKPSWNKSPNAINMIKLVSRDKNKTYSEFIKNIASSKNKGAIMIKIADNEDNLEPSRVLPKEYDGLKDRYRKSLEILKKETNK